VRGGVCRLALGDQYLSGERERNIHCVCRRNIASRQALRASMAKRPRGVVSVLPRASRAQRRRTASRRHVPWRHLVRSISPLIYRYIARLSGTWRRFAFPPRLLYLTYHIFSLRQRGAAHGFSGGGERKRRRRARGSCGGMALSRHLRLRISSSRSLQHKQRITGTASSVLGLVIMCAAAE